MGSLTLMFDLLLVSNWQLEDDVAVICSIILSMRRLLFRRLIILFLMSAASVLYKVLSPQCCIQLQPDGCLKSCQLL